MKKTTKMILGVIGVVLGVLGTWLSLIAWLNSRGLKSSFSKVMSDIDDATGETGAGETDDSEETDIKEIREAMPFYWQEFTHEQIPWVITWINMKYGGIEGFYNTHRVVDNTKLYDPCMVNSVNKELMTEIKKFIKDNYGVTFLTGEEMYNRCSTNIVWLERYGRVIYNQEIIDIVQPDRNGDEMALIHTYSEHVGLLPKYCISYLKALPEIKKERE